ncbi:MAG: twin transmembrane helix small protein [Novosphingobium sp.]
MKYLLIPVLIVLMGLVVYSLVRGIAAFMQATKLDLEHDPASGPSPSQVKQNKMMFNRILFQGLAVLVVAVLLAASGK